MKIISLSVFTVDYYPKVGLKRVGGNSANFALECVWQGHQVSVLGAIGNDENGQIIKNHFITKGLEISHLYELDGISANNKLVNDHNGERFQLEGAWCGGVYETFRVSKTDIDYINSYDLVATTIFDPNFQTVIDNLPKGKNCVIDFMHTTDFEAFEKNITKISIPFFSNDRQILDKAQQVSRKHNRLIVITMGAEGSQAFLGVQSVYCPPPKPVKVIDTTGCGDVFQAAFSLSWFENHDISKALNAGTEASAKILTKFGGC